MVWNTAAVLLHEATGFFRNTGMDPFNKLLDQLGSNCFYGLLYSHLLNIMVGTPLTEVLGLPMHSQYD